MYAYIYINKYINIYIYTYIYSSAYYCDGINSGMTYCLQSIINTLFLHRPLFLKGENENGVSWKNWVGGEAVSLKSRQGKRKGNRENSKTVRVIRCIYFNLLTIDYHGN